MSHITAPRAKKQNSRLQSTSQWLRQPFPFGDIHLYLPPFLRFVNLGTLAANRCITATIPRSISKKKRVWYQSIKRFVFCVSRKLSVHRNLLLALVHLNCGLKSVCWRTIQSKLHFQFSNSVLRFSFVKVRNFSKFQALCLVSKRIS